ncbi:ABC transporter permease [Telluribacter sp.]|jgi:phospholipid/cholesterol/gamma-HCH transport system permease protein|uniref:MlaE family ABC transporter permease n=1 Tax=Telluribacter sp. TaxID=1978767 RepID=UPI002E1160D2|nr:ABC transporter permease [Telluribacter sp.]
MVTIGKYFVFLGYLFTRREKLSIYWTRFLEEAVNIGVNSVFIVAIVSTFIGAVSCIQTAYNLVSPFIPVSTVALIVRDMEILELAPTITCVVLAGKVGSNIAGELGTMRITEQVDALEVMGINSASYLVLPKVIAAMVTFPMLVILSAFLGILGGYLAGTLTGVLTPKDYVEGIRDSFVPYNIFFMCVKPFVFGFLISTISSYQGYFTKGGALEVGQSSTQAVTNSCIAILVADYLLAQLFL